MFNFTLLISIVILLVSPIIIFFLGKWNEEIAKWSAFVFTVISAIFFALTLGEVLNGTGHTEAWNWIDFTINGKAISIDFSLVADNLSFPIAAIIFILSIAALVYSFGYMKEAENKSAYYALLVLYIAGMVGVVLAGDLIQFYIFWELMLIPSYFIIAKWGSKPNSVKIAFKYFIFTHVGAMAILIGIGGLWAYGTTDGSFTLALLDMSSAPALVVRVLTILFLLGFMVKMAIFPIHSWLPDTHGEAPTPISAILSGVMIETAVYGIVRICSSILGERGMGGWMSWVLIGLAVFTMIYGGIMALAQKDTKRLFAYSSISQMGYMLFGLGTFTLFGTAGSTFHIVSHALAKGSLFMVAGVLMTQIGHHKGRDLTKIKGLGLKMPITAIVALIAALSLAGTPPLAGFMSEWIIFEGGLKLNNTLGIIAVVFAVLSTALTATYVLLFMKDVFLGPTQEEFEDITDPSPSMWIPLAILAVLSFVVGLLPNSVLVFVTEAVKTIFP